MVLENLPWRMALIGGGLLYATRALARRRHGGWPAPHPAQDFNAHRQDASEISELVVKAKDDIPPLVGDEGGIGQTFGRYIGRT